jgi:transglutaminase-like putative cysteine protease
MKWKIAIAVLILLLIVARLNDYIYGLWVFYKIGKNITVNIKDDTEKARAAAYWVFDNIKGVERYAYFKNIDDNFMNVYRRRMGSCDQSAWVYVVMTNLLGLNSRVLYLVDDSGGSPHTVASVKIKDNEYIVDTLIHYMFDLSDQKAFKEYQNLFKEYCIRYYGNTTSGCCEPQISWFKNGVYSDTFKEKIVKRLLRKN